MTFTLDWWLIGLCWVSIVVNVAVGVWSWRQGTRFYRASRVLCELCLTAWPMRRDPRLAQHYIDTVGRWSLSKGKER